MFACFSQLSFCLTYFYHFDDFNFTKSLFPYETYRSICGKLEFQFVGLMLLVFPIVLMEPAAETETDV
jgi:hypothetical protein